MTGLRIEAMDADDDSRLSAWCEVYDAADRHDRALAVPLGREELRPIFLAEDTGERVLGFLGLAQVEGCERAVCAGRIDLPLRDNLHTAYVQVFTEPGLTGRGFGSRMLSHLEEVARQHSRAVLDAEAVAPYDGPSDGSGSHRVDFARRRGFGVVLGDVVRVLDLPVEPARLARLAHGVEDHHVDYQLRQWTGPVPDDVVDDFGALMGSLMTQAPTGTRDVEPEVFDADRIRADERVFAAAGRTKHTTVAVAADGSLAAYTEIAVPAHDPGRCFQWGTLVRPEHRGHRLGTAVKALNLAAVQSAHPDLRTLVTYNAEVNSHMINVNEALGFRPVERLVELQKRLDPGR